MRRAAVAGLAALAGCGGGGDTGPRVGAASSLTEALTACAPTAQLEFGGSDDLAAQVRQGVGLDVFAAANMALPAQLAKEGKSGRPVPFATNELVLAVPRDSAVNALAGLRGARLVVGSPAVPVGAYTRQVLARLPRARRDALRAQVRSEEPDVKGVIGKLITGAADAGFVYRTDVRAAGGRLRAVALPARLRPRVVYGVSVVRDRAAARNFVADLRHGRCASELRRAGFGPPP